MLQRLILIMFRKLLHTKGLGVQNSGGSKNQILNNEYLVFTFPEIFYGNLKITFSNWNNKDQAKITMNDGNFELFKSNGGVFTSNYSKINKFKVEGTNKGKFRIAKVELVPEPNAIVFLGLGLIAIGFLRRKKRNNLAL
jgi:hypothetical protein